MPSTVRHRTPHESDLFTARFRQNPLPVKRALVATRSAEVLACAPPYPAKRQVSRAPQRAGPHERELAPGEPATEERGLALAL
jgi:hypothetical protein